MGKVKAAHALAKIAAVSNPDMALPRGAGGCPGGWDGAMGRVSSAPRGAFLLVPLLLAWEGAWCWHRGTVNWRLPDSRVSSACD